MRFMQIIEVLFEFQLSLGNGLDLYQTYSAKEHSHFRYMIRKFLSLLF